MTLGMGAYGAAMQQQQTPSTPTDARWAFVFDAHYGLVGDDDGPPPHAEGDPVRAWTGMAAANDNDDRSATATIPAEVADPIPTAWRAGGDGGGTATFLADQRGRPGVHCRADTTMRLLGSSSYHLEPNRSVFVVWSLPPPPPPRDARTNHNNTASFLLGTPPNFVGGPESSLQQQQQAAPTGRQLVVKRWTSMWSRDDLQVPTTSFAADAGPFVTALRFEPDPANRGFVRITLRESVDPAAAATPVYFDRRPLSYDFEAVPGTMQFGGGGADPLVVHEIRLTNAFPLSDAQFEAVFDALRTKWTTTTTTP